MADVQNKEKKPRSVSKEDDRTSRIPGVIDDFTARIREIRSCATQHIGIAEERQLKFVESVKERLTITQSPDATVEFKLEAVADFVEAFGRPTESHPDILSRSLLIYAFSTFDAFVGLLLRRLYREVPALIYQVEEKELTVSDVLKARDLDDLVNKVIERDVSSLLRSSYEEQFSKLETRFSIETLKKFATWPLFIEAAQRRNLITHCNGEVNDYYLNACTKAGFKFGTTPPIGTKLTVSTTYLRQSLDILYEVGVMLSHVLWRKSAPTEIGQAETALAQELYLILRREEWDLAKKLGRFAVTLPKQKRDLSTRIARINYAQALKWSGENDTAEKVLDAVDWTGSIRDLRLGVEVLKDNFEEAAKLMREIGRNGELLRRKSYYDWPVFREFRKSVEFLTAFKQVFGMDYAENIPGTGRAGMIEKQPREPATGAGERSDTGSTGEHTMPPTPETEPEIEDAGGASCESEE